MLIFNGTIMDETILYIRSFSFANNKDYLVVVIVFFFRSVFSFVTELTEKKNFKKCFRKKNHYKRNRE